MNNRAQKYLAPVIILVIILVLWEGLVTAFQIEQFLLPRPSVIVANLVRVVTLTSDASPLAISEIETQIKANKFFVSIPADSPEELLETLLSAKIFQFSAFGNKYLLLKGNNLSPIVQAGLFTLREALGGFVLGCLAGILVALSTARWTATREALLPFAIAANSMPIIAFAPIMNNWFGLDNPFSKMAIVAIMTFFPMMINTVRGLTSVDPRSLELMRSYAASDFEILRRLRVPNSLPYLFNGFKIAAALSMIGAIVGEYFGGPRIALGVFITQEAALFRFSSAWAAISIACLMGIALYLLILLAERLAMPWHVSFRK
jgi:NitT/TauT family transport system permease protein